MRIRGCKDLNQFKALATDYSKGELSNVSKIPGDPMSSEKGIQIVKPLKQYESPFVKIYYAVKVAFYGMKTSGYHTLSTLSNIIPARFKSPANDNEGMIAADHDYSVAKSDYEGAQCGRRTIRIIYKGSTTANIAEAVEKVVEKLDLELKLQTADFSTHSPVDQANICLRLAKIYQNEGNYDDAIRCLTKVSLQPLDTISALDEKIVYTNICVNLFTTFGDLSEKTKCPKEKVQEYRNTALKLKNDLGDLHYKKYVDEGESNEPENLNNVALFYSQAMLAGVDCSRKLCEENGDLTKIETVLIRVKTLIEETTDSKPVDKERALNEIQASIDQIEKRIRQSNDNKAEAAAKAVAEQERIKTNAAAIKIQSVFRGHLERRLFLKNSLLEGAKPFIDQPEKREDLPMASSGKTRVFFPDDLPIVLKQSGSPGNKTRFHKMKQAREICDGSHYSHVVIPTARIHGDFIIESRLPIIKDHKMKMHIGFYLEHLEQFTEAVGEFTGFLCQTRLGDITGGTNDPYSSLSEVPIGRYDNVAMYLEKGIGKLGLIDLEMLYSIKSEKEQQKGAAFACIEAIRLFPHHLEAIIEAARKFDPNIENHREALETERASVLKYYKNAYQDHLDFVKQKNIDLTNPVKFTEILPLRNEKIREAVEIAIQKEIKEGGLFKDCLGKTPELAMQRFNEEAFPEILDSTRTFITELLKDQLDHQGGIEAISSYSKLLSLRTLELHNLERYENFKKTIASKLGMLTFNPKFQNGELHFAFVIIDAILKELEKGKEIAYYNPRFGIGGYAFPCIFC